MARFTKIKIEFTIIFDNNTDMKTVTDETGLTPNSAINKSDAKNPFYKVADKPDDWAYEDEHMPASWTLETEYIKTVVLEEVTDSLITKIKPRIDNIISVLQKYDGTAHFSIVTVINRNYKPALCFNEEFIEIISLLKATVDIDIYF